MDTEGARGAVPQMQDALQVPDTTGPGNRDSRHSAATMLVEFMLTCVHHTSTCYLPVFFPPALIEHIWLSSLPSPGKKNIVASVILFSVWRRL